MRDQIPVGVYLLACNFHFEPFENALSAQMRSAVRLRRDAFANSRVVLEARCAAGSRLIIALRRALAILRVRAAALDILVSAVNKKAFRLFGWISDLAF